MRWLSLLVVLAVGACSSPEAKLKQICQQKAGITVYDQTAWAAYIGMVKEIDLEQQQSMLEARRDGRIIAPADARKFISPFPYVSGFKIIWQHERYSGQPQPGSSPESNHKTVMRGSQRIGVLHDFEVRQNNFGYSRNLSCSNSFPETYGIRRAKVLK